MSNKLINKTQSWFADFRAWQAGLTKIQHFVIIVILILIIIAVYSFNWSILRIWIYS